MSRLDITLKNGEEKHFDDVLFFEPRMLEEMNKDGEFEASGDAIYFERESDEVGQGTLINSDELAEYELDGVKTIMTNEHKTIMDGEVWKTETDDRWITEGLEETEEHDEIEM